MPFPYVFPFELPSDAEIAAEAEAQGQNAVDRLAQYIIDKPNVLATINALCTEAASMVSMFGDLLTDRQFAAAFGLQLDNIGEIIIQPRLGLADDEYRLVLQAKIKANNSSGCPEEIYEVIDLIRPDDSTMALLEQGTASAVFRLFGVEIEEAVSNSVERFLRTMKAGGVRLVFEWLVAEPADTFTLDGTADQALDNGAFASAVLIES